MADGGAPAPLSQFVFIDFGGTRWAARYSQDELDSFNVRDVSRWVLSKGRTCLTLVTRAGHTTRSAAIYAWTNHPDRNRRSGLCRAGVAIVERRTFPGVSGI